MHRAGEAAALRTAIAQAESRSEASSHEVSRLAVELSLATAAKDEALQRAAALSHQKQVNIVDSYSACILYAKKQH